MLNNRLNTCVIDFYCILKKVLNLRNMNTTSSNLEIDIILARKLRFDVSGIFIYLNFILEI